MERASAARTKLRTLIVDDEELARKALLRVLRQEADIEIVGECAEGSAALQRIAELTPDLVFLDIRMRGMSGLDVLRQVPEDERPHVIFVTAYDEYAVRAFDLHAADYVLKPIDDDRLRAALGRVRRQHRSHQRAQRYDELVDMLRRASTTDAGDAVVPANAVPRYATRLIVRSEGRMYFVPTSQIDYIEADRNYVKLHTGAETHTMREQLGRLTSVLDPRVFARIHRSTIVNLNRIREIQPWFTGDFLVLLHDGTRLRMSRTFRDALDRHLSL
jgi:two-component system LytT family response regulator